MQDFLSYDAERKNESYVNGTIISFATPDISLEAMVHCLSDMQRRVGRRRKELLSTNGRMVNTASKQ